MAGALITCTSQYFLYLGGVDMLKLIKRCPEYVYGYKEYCQEAFGHNVIYFRPVNPELIDDGWFERTKEWYDKRNI